MSAPFRAAFWTYGFRPFFLLAALVAVVTLAVLYGALLHGVWPAAAPRPGRWHGHEMLFGFVAAAIAGFLLTAVPTWTNRAATTGAPLAVLVAVWLAGRIVMSPALGLLGTPFVLIDALFFPALAVTVGVSLVAARNYRNWQFLPILLAFTVADLAFLGTELGWLAQLPFDPLRFAANLVQLMIAVVGGRIIPAFTRNALLKSGVKVEIAQRPWLDRAALIAVTAVLGVDLAWPDGTAAGVVAVAAAVLLALRLAQWHGHRTARMPIVWVLHAGYAWLIVSLALKAAWTLGGFTWAAQWLHALTAGAFGTMVLGVMTRVALGHTGRPLVVAAPITVAYGLVIVGAALRVAGPAVLPAHTLATLQAAMACWAGAFVIFIAVYLPILLAPRVARP
jgi:uncharacterized protein involved in response to NO